MFNMIFKEVIKTFYFTLYSLYICLLYYNIIIDLLLSLFKANYEKFGKKLNYKLRSNFRFSIQKIPKTQVKQSKNQNKKHGHQHHHHKHHSSKQKQQIPEQNVKVQNLEQELNILPFKCDNCNNNVSYCYCEQCKRIYCYSCWQSLHQQALKDHTRILDHNIIEELTKLCQQHNIKSTLWCLTCQKPLCDLCLQTHSKLHQILPVTQAQAILNIQLKQLLQNDTRKNFENLYQQYLQTLQVTDSEYEMFMKEIESKAQNLKNSLKTRRSEKLIEIQSFKEDLENIVEDYRECESGYGEVNNQYTVNTVQQPQVLSINKIFGSLQKLEKINKIDPKIYQIALQKYSPHVNWSHDDQDIKSQMVTDLLNKQLQSEQAEHKLQVEKYIQELSKYENLVEQYAQELQKIQQQQQMRCLWCGELMTKENVNGGCKCNTDEMKNMLQSKKLEFLRQCIDNSINNDNYNCEQSTSQNNEHDYIHKYDQINIDNSKIDIKQSEKHIGDQKHFWI